MSKKRLYKIADFPNLIKEWDYDRNIGLFPENISSGSSSIKVNWTCNKGHSWEATPNTRSRGRGCPYCVNKKVCEDNCLANINPKLASEWSLSKNGSLTPFDFIAKSGKKAWWVCDKGHEWESPIHWRSKGNGCPYCANKKVCEDNCLSLQNPELSLEWNYEKNLLCPDQVVYCNTRRKEYWWKCKSGHEWLATMGSRYSGNCCPECNLSKGEKAVSLILTKLEIDFTIQFKFDDCRDIMPLPFDFMFEHNNYKHVVEYQGEQHFRSIVFGKNSKSTFEKIQRHDDIKRDFCKKNNINLIEIPYTKINDIEFILMQRLLLKPTIVEATGK